MTQNPSFSLISTKKIIQMNDVWTSYDSKNFALEGINMSIDRGATMQLSEFQDLESQLYSNY